MKAKLEILKFHGIRFTYYFVFVFLALCSIFVSCARWKTIDEILVYHSFIGQRYSEYKIDLKNKQLWKDSNEGFTLLDNLEDEKIHIFLQEAKKYGFASWKKSYFNPDVFDGDQWGITITFSDSTQRLISGSNKYPKTWDNMLLAFEDLTGENILIYKSDWITKRDKIE